MLSNALTILPIHGLYNNNNDDNKELEFYNKGRFVIKDIFTIGN